MESDIQALIDKANKILNKSSKGPGVRYPAKIKEIVATLVNDHHFTVNQITKYIPVSAFSAREWPKKNKKQFRKVRITKTPKREYKKREKSKFILEVQIVLISLQVLLIALQIFFH